MDLNIRKDCLQSDVHLKKALFLNYNFRMKLEILNSLKDKNPFDQTFLESYKRLSF